MEIQVFRNENSSQTNAYSHYSSYSYSGLIPNERAVKKAKVSGSGSDGVSKVKDEAEDMVPYLAWFDPFYKARKTISNRLLQLIQKMKSQKSMNDKSR